MFKCTTHFQMYVPPGITALGGTKKYNFLISQSILKFGPFQMCAITYPNALKTFVPGPIIPSKLIKMQKKVGQFWHPQSSSFPSMSEILHWVDWALRYWASRTKGIIGKMEQNTCKTPLYDQQHSGSSTLNFSVDSVHFFTFMENWNSEQFKTRLFEVWWVLRELLVLEQKYWGRWHLNTLVL